MKPRIVRGYTNGSWPDGPGQWLKEVSGEPDEVWNVPVLLLPDDGTQVVVGREEWERRDEALRACESVLRLVHEAAGPLERGAPMPTHTTFAAWRLAAAILGTNGGEK